MAQQARPGRFTVVTDRQDPMAVERLLRALPDWFGIESALLEYVKDAERLPNYLAYNEEQAVVGALLLARHNARSAEIHVLAVAPECHRRGVGRALVQAVETDLLTSGVRLLQVKTLGPSRPDENYARTLRFYEAMGFLALQEIHGLWPEDPCLILVKPLPAEEE